MSAVPSRYAVAGNPVEHSLSPFIHAEFARRTGETLSYGRLLCPLDGFARTLRAFAADGAAGCNVTLPFKFEAFASAAARSARAELAGACNTLRFDADGWAGDNTDGAGLVRDIEQGAGVALRGARVLIVGAGGASAGVLGPLLDAGVAEVTIANRRVERARALVERHRAAPQATSARLVATALDGCDSGFDVVVNATSSSVAGDGVPVAASVLKPGALAIDLMYGPASEPFLRWTSEHGAIGRDGLGMLVEQAAEAFLFWRAVRPETPPVLAALRRHLATR